MGHMGWQRSGPPRQSSDVRFRHYLGIFFSPGFGILRKVVFLLDTVFLFTVYFNLAEDQSVNSVHSLSHQLFDSVMVTVCTWVLVHVWLR